MIRAKEAWQTSHPNNPVHRIRVSREGSAVNDQDEKKLFVDVRGVEKIEDASDNNLKHAIALAVIRDVRRGLLNLRTLAGTNSFVTTMPRPVSFCAAAIYHTGIGIIDRSRNSGLRKAFASVRMDLNAARIAHLTDGVRSRRPKNDLKK